MDSPIRDKWNSNKKIIVYTRRKKGTSSGNNVSHATTSKGSVANTDGAKTDGSCKIGADDTIAKKVDEPSEREITSIIGGDDSVPAVEKDGFADKIHHISIGGDASFELLEGNQLPGVLALDDALAKK